MVPKRRKTSDVFATSQPLLGTTTDLREAFPTIEAIRVDAVTRFDRSGRARKTGVYGPSQFIDCTNPRCSGGGFPLGQYLRNMTSGGTREDSWARSCGGYEDRRMKIPCVNSFSVKATIKYVEKAKAT